MDIAEVARYDVGAGAKHDVGMSGDWCDGRLVWIELRVEVPKNVLSVIVNSETHQSVQIKYARHKDE
ncbi:MAG: hypothetical protein WBQ18_09545 [Solirubrobacteraceae bacterium]|jgi:hypothetical protein